MRICSSLYKVYGQDTRSAQTVNIISLLMWGGALFLHNTGTVIMLMPTFVLGEYVSVLCIIGTALFFGALGLLTTGRAHQIYKTFALVLGALVQLIFANGYLTEYPPLDMMVSVCTAFGLWLFGAAWFVLRCEGINGYTTRP